MGLYFGETEMQGLHFGDTEITGLYFGDTEIWAAWAEYDGTLPATYTANGSMLADYRIYGASGGVGDRTVNIYDWTDTGYGLEYGRALTIDGTTAVSGNWCISSYIEAKPLTAYAINWYESIPYQGNYLCEYDENYNFIGSVLETSNLTFTTSQQTKYLRLTNTYRNTERHRRENCVLVEGSTAPTEYVPYGYEVPMSVSDGTTSTTTPVYIGDEPLGEDECVDYGSGKIYRMIDSTLTPTDPPVQLPQLPTCNGVTITNYAGQSAAVPSRFYAKYKKGGQTS